MTTQTINGSNYIGGLEDWRVSNKGTCIYWMDWLTQRHRLGFGVFLNNPDDASRGSMYEYNDYLPEPCQINLDYAGE